MSYGPFDYPRSLVIGFIAGTMGFILAGTLGDGYKDVDQLPIFAGWTAAGTLLAAAATAIANYVVGKRIKAEKDFQREIFSGSDLPPPMPRPDVPGIMLQKPQPVKRPPVRSDVEAA
jgi:hypothetical protein